jgi:hypothetical protein
MTRFWAALVHDVAHQNKTPKKSIALHRKILPASPIAFILLRNALEAILRYEKRAGR